MLPSITHFLRTILQKLLADHAPGRKQINVQEVHLPERNTQASAAPVRKSLKETDAIPTVMPGVKGPDTEPHRALAYWKRPAQRYRTLDAMLEEMKKDRLTGTDTVMVPIPAHYLARQLHRSLEREK